MDSRSRRRRRRQRVARQLLRAHRRPPTNNAKLDTTDTGAAPELTPPTSGPQIEAALQLHPERHNLSHAVTLGVTGGHVSRARTRLVKAEKLHQFTGETEPLTHDPACWCHPDLQPGSRPKEPWALVVWRGQQIKTAISHYATRAQAEAAVPDDDDVIDTEVIDITAKPKRRRWSIDEVLAAGRRPPPDAAKRENRP